MKMIMTVIAKKSSETVINALVNEGYMVTFGETRGGMLRQSESSIFIAVEDSLVDPVLAIIEKNCKSRTQAIDVPAEGGQADSSGTVNFELGGAVTFVWSLDRLEKC